MINTAFDKRFIEEIRRYNLWCDLDGVFADFEWGFKVLCGSPISMRETDEEAAWEIIKKTPNFWLQLRPIPGAIAFWEALCSITTPCILTSPSSHDTERAIKEKRQWVDRWLGRHVPVFYRRSKWKHTLASPDAILIDDWKENIDLWLKAGGHAIHHETIASTVEQLKLIASTKRDLHSFIQRVG